MKLVMRLEDLFIINLLSLVTNISSQSFIHKYKKRKFGGKIDFDILLPEAI